MKYFKNEANEEEMSIAFQYFSKAAEMYEKGEGFKKSFKQAKKYFELAAENNHKDSALRAKKSL